MRTMLSATGASVLILSVLLCSVLLCGPAIAGRNANGAMLLHVNPNLTYSALQPYCDDVAYPLPPTCEQLVTNDTRDPSVESIIWMVAVFMPSSSPGVKAFQVGLGGDVDNSWFTDWSACPAGYFEIPDAGWPGTGTGDAVAFPNVITATMWKMYWFACGAPGVGSTLSTTNYYNGDHHAEWADDSQPPVTDFCNWFGEIEWGGPGYNQCACCGPAACCFPDGSCQLLSQTDCGTAGGSYQGDNTVCDPNPCPWLPLGACCFAADGSCQLLTQAECDAAGGNWQGVGTTCDPNPCPQPVGACCFCDYTCQMLTEADCLAQGGMFFGVGTDCATIQCAPPPPGACCVGQECLFMSEWCCDLQHGEFQGSGTVCEPNPCIPVPTRAATWGEIKLGYR